jgi:fatty-acyl-CoA synthase
MADLGWNLIHRVNLGDMLRRTAARFPQKTALAGSNQRVTYRANQLARFLQQAGIGRGDAVAFLGLNSVEYAAAFFGCALIGAPLVPVNLMLSPEDIDYLLDRVHAKALLLDPVLEAKINWAGSVNRLPNIWRLTEELKATIEAVDASAVETYVESEDAATIIFTSGTTARPKGVVNTHINWFASMLSAFADSTYNRHWTSMLALPMFHIAGLFGLAAVVASGMTGILIPLPRPDLIVRAIEEHRPDLMGLPATVYVGLLHYPGIEKVDLSCFKRLGVFQYLPTNLFQKWRQMAPGAEWMNYWGQSEMTPLGSSTPPEDLGRKLIAPDPIGIPHTPLEVRVVDDEMNELGPHQIGELVCRGPSIMPGYFEDPAANEAVFRGGWHHTGDMGYKDEEGFLYFADRKKDMIKSGGENVSSQEVEEAIAAHPAVQEVAVIGVHDPYWIEKVVAVVVVRPGSEVTEDELYQHGRAALATFKAPKEVRIVESLPKNPTGKILKRELRKSIEEHAE